MKIKTLTKDRADLAEHQSSGQIKFRWVNNAVTGVEFPSPIGPLFLELSSYSVTVNELDTKKVYDLGFFAQAGAQKIFVEERFNTEAERERYINDYLSDVARDELSLSEDEVVA